MQWIGLSMDSSNSYFNGSYAIANQKDWCRITQHVCSIKATVASCYSYWMKILISCDAIFNKQECKQECIAIVLFCLNHGHSEHKQKDDVHGYRYWSMATFMTTSYWVAAQITHLQSANATNAHACMMLSWFISTMSWFSPRDHLRHSGPSMAAIVGPGGPSTATQFAVDSPGEPIVVGDHLRCDSATSCSIWIVFWSERKTNLH